MRRRPTADGRQCPTLRRADAEGTRRCDGPRRGTANERDVAESDVCGVARWAWRVRETAAIELYAQAAAAFPGDDVDEAAKNAAFRLRAGSRVLAPPRECRLSAGPVVASSGGTGLQRVTVPPSPSGRGNSRQERSFASGARLRSIVAGYATFRAVILVQS